MSMWDTLASIVIVNLQGMKDCMDPSLALGTSEVGGTGAISNCTSTK